MQEKKEEDLQQVLNKVSEVGIDEVGRGAVFGPVFSAVVVLTKKNQTLLKKFGIIDPLCGLKCYNLRFCKDKNFDRYNSIGTDLMLRLVKKNVNFINLNIKVKKRKDKPRFGNSIISNLRIIFQKFFS